MRLKLQKQSALKFSSRIIQIAKGYWKQSQEQSERGIDPAKGGRLNTVVYC
jgi:hypothetical protein